LLRAKSVHIYNYTKLSFISDNGLLLLRAKSVHIYNYTKLSFTQVKI